MSKSVGTGPSSYKKKNYRAAVSQRLCCNFFGASAIWEWVGRTAKRVSGTNVEVLLMHNLIPYLYYVTEPCDKILDS